MRVTIEHREQASGVTGKHKDCYVDCKVEFNEEERAIVKARDLWTEGFSGPNLDAAAYHNIDLGHRADALRRPFHDRRRRHLGNRRRRYADRSPVFRRHRLDSLRLAARAQ